MRLAFVTREFPELGATGGIGTYTQTTARALARRGHDVTVIAYSPTPKAPYQREGVRVEPVSCKDAWRLPAFNGPLALALRSLPFAEAAGRRARALAAQGGRFDVLEIPEYQAWGLGAARHGVASAVVARLHGHTRLVRRLNGSPEQLDVALLSRLERLTLNRCDLALSNSQALAESLLADLGKLRVPVEVLPLGIDGHRFRPDRLSPAARAAVRAEWGVASDAPVALYVGRLERRKGVLELLPALAAASARAPEAVLVLAGFSTATGPGGSELLAHLKQEAARLGLAHRVRFLGNVPYERLPSVYAASDVLVAPSRYEPFGLIYLEAMAAGLPAIGCTSGGVPEILEDGRTGRLVPPEAAAALGAALGELLAEPALRQSLGWAARAEFEARFDIDRIAERTEARYAALLGARGRQGSAVRPASAWAKA